MADKVTRALPFAWNYGDVWIRARAERRSGAEVTLTATKTSEWRIACAVGSLGQDASWYDIPLV